MKENKMTTSAGEGKGCGLGEGTHYACDCMLKQLSTLQSLVEKYEGALEKVEYKQTEIISMLRKNGFVFANKGGRWEKLAFTLYTDICELRQLAKAALESKRGAQQHEPPTVDESDMVP